MEHSGMFIDSGNNAIGHFTLATITGSQVGSRNLNFGGTGHKRLLSCAMSRNSTAVGLAHRLLLVGGFAPALIINLVENSLRVPMLCDHAQLIGFIDKCRSFIDEEFFNLLNT